jgi:hypothetical protein
MLMPMSTPITPSAVMSSTKVKPLAVDFVTGSLR